VASGFAVQPPTCTRRLLSSMKNSTYSVFSHTVSTVKKSEATTLAVCWRNAGQLIPPRRPGPSPWRRSSVRIVVADTRTPSFANSP
jgi:hypothetical protein